MEWKVSAIPREIERASESAGLCQSGATPGSDCGVHRVLQLLPASKGNEERDADRGVLHFSLVATTVYRTVRRKIY